MADLIVIAFDTEEQAEGAYEKVQELQGDLIVQLAGLALVTVDHDGKTHVKNPGAVGNIGLGAAGGALFGTLIGILFFIPFVGLVFGGLFGALFAGIDKTGLNSEFRAQVKDAVSAGKSAVVVYTTKLTEDKFAAALAPYNGTVIKTSLSAEDEQALIHDLSGQPTA
ncbi:DUF1269 domain-containing protein [Herbiconiux sp. KACC 21604]|uniref:DUF1269 domain-containing protein n=1 Tax=Herbiconiux sp. A18JL235 TaxID=3152363 RepID=A0AB39BB56_9MICO|nr:DUF1269 domain-containing protein [Herbiconiux sp. SALV-R1]QJU53519.1 DUF1269 domain-containing protein [Herbiconiux sp. SALV-R1]WPO88497.1 DUF1269 domain-containing protein [Herbiconiux sp. KACC 21604]